MLQLRTLFFFSLLTWSTSLIGEVTNVDDEEKHPNKEVSLEALDEQNMAKHLIHEKKRIYATLGKLIGFFSPLVIWSFLAIVTYLILNFTKPTSIPYFMSVAIILVMFIAINSTLIGPIIGKVYGNFLGQARAHSILKKIGAFKNTEAFPKKPDESNRAKNLMKKKKTKYAIVGGVIGFFFPILAFIIYYLLVIIDDQARRYLDITELPTKAIIRIGVIIMIILCIIEPIIGGVIGAYFDKLKTHAILCEKGILSSFSSSIGAI